MAYVAGKNGYFEFTDGYLTVRVRWSETYDIEGNSSIVQVDSIDVKSTAMLGTWCPSLFLVINGETVATMSYWAPATHKVAINAANTYYSVVSNGTGTNPPWVSSPITHDDQGKKSITISVVANPAGHNLSSIQLYRTSDGMTRTFGASQDAAIALTDIPRRALLTVSNGTLGVEQTLGVTRYYEGFTHTITCTVGSATETICEKDTGTSYLWTPPLALAAQIPNAAKGTATFTIYTYNGSTLIGSQTVPVEMAVPASIVPTVSATWSDTSGAKDKMGTFVKLVSALAVDVAGVGVYGSTITGASMTLNGKAYAGGVIMDAGSLELVVTVNDSRGRSGSVAYTVTVADYAVPSVMLNASRCDEDGTANDMGEFAKVTITGTVVQVNEVNTARLQLTYGAATETYAFEPGAIEHVQIIPAPSVSALAIAATLTDQLKSTAQSMVLSIGYATMDFLAGGKGIAFGTTARQEGFHCAMPAYFTGGIGGCIADYVVEQGTDDIWTYRKWNSGIAECWGEQGFTVTWAGASPAYYSTNKYYPSFPSGLFAAAPCTSVSTPNGNAAYVVPCVFSVGVGYMGISFGRFYGGATDVTATIKMYCIGMWK